MARQASVIYWGIVVSIACALGLSKGLQICMSKCSTRICVADGIMYSSRRHFHLSHTVMSWPFVWTPCMERLSNSLCAPQPSMAFLIPDFANPLPLTRIRFQESMAAQLPTARAVDLARVVTALCDMGVRPHPAVLQQLLSLGPVPDFSLKMMTELHRAITTLLKDGERKARLASQDYSPDADAPTAPSQPQAAFEAPGEGAGAAEIDAFVDAARSQLGAKDSRLVGETSEERGQAEAEPAGRAAQGLWRYAMDDDAQLQAADEGDGFE